MAIARALRPLGRRRGFGPPVVLDELASAERIAETQLPLPVLVPRRERWFEVVLAVEDTPSFVAWKATVTQLQRMLERHGGFRSVSRVSLALQGGAIAIRSLAGRLRPFASMSDRHGRRLVIVVSDCTSAAWHSGAMGDWLARLAPRVPLAIAQPLPASLWSHTALGFAEFSAHATVPGTPTARLDIVRPRWADGEPGPVVPVFALEPDAVRRWARMVMASGNAFAVAALVPPRSPGVPADPGGSGGGESGEGPMPSPLELLAGFRAAASADAQQLATFLSAVKPLTLPVMRLLQSVMLPQSGVAALAQILISGIVAPAAAPGSVPAGEDEVMYEMAGTVREQLTTGLLRSDWLRVSLAVQRYVAEQTGRGFDFFAYLEDRLGEERIEPAALPFAQFTRSLADRFRAPGATPGAAAARTRAVDEPIFGNGLTVRAARRFSTPTRELRWSADGWLAVLHQVGVDVFGARELALLAREREGPHLVEWLVHPDDLAVIEPLLARLESEAERQSGQPFRFEVGAFERQRLAFDADKERRERASASWTGLIALTQRFSRAASSRPSHWIAQVERSLGVRTIAGWTAVPLDLAWVDPAAERWTLGWSGVLANPADSQATRDAVGALVEKVRGESRAEDGGRILDVAWGSADDAAPQLYSLRSAAGEALVVDAVRGAPGQTPKWLGAPRGPRTRIVDFDACASALAAAYPNGEVWAWAARRQWRGVLLYKGERGKARAVRWAPQDRVLGWLEEGGFQATWRRGPPRGPRGQQRLREAPAAAGPLGRVLSLQAVDRRPRYAAARWGTGPPPRGVRRHRRESPRSRRTRR